MKHKVSLTILLLFSIFQLFPCTIGIVRADLTERGRPIIWKSRDSSVSNTYPVYNVNGIYPYVGVITNNVYDRVWMGVNSKGFSILNSLSLDLQGNNSSGNGNFMAYALSNFENIEHFEDYLNQSNSTGRATKGNFAVTDANGNAIMYEISNNSWEKFDVNNVDDYPEGYIIRTNFSFTGGSSNGIERYERAIYQMETLKEQGLINVSSLIDNLVRDFSFEANQAYEIPYYGHTYGYESFIDIKTSICNQNTTNAVIIEGINNYDEIPIFWSITGFPAVTPVMPYIPRFFMQNSLDLAGLSQEIKSLLMNIPNYSSLLNTIYFHQDDLKGIWDLFDSYEEDIITDFYQLLEDDDESFNFNTFMISLSIETYYLMLGIKNSLNNTITDDDTVIAIQNPKLRIYPNPVKSVFNIDLNHDFENDLKVTIFNIKGQVIHEGIYNSKLDTSFKLDNNISSGVYLIKISDGEVHFSAKFLKVK